MEFNSNETNGALVKFTQYCSFSDLGFKKALLQKLQFYFWHCRAGQFFDVGK
jgi:hypothetical protein